MSRSLGIGLVALGGLGAFVAMRMELVTDITAFLPTGDDPELAALSRQIARSELSRTMVLTVGAPDEQTAVAAGRAFEEALRADPRVSDHLAFLDGGPPEGVERAIWDLYQPRRLSFVAESGAAAGDRLTTEGLTAAAREIKRRLGLPISTLVTRVAPGDPFLSLPALFERLQARRSERVRVHGGRFLTEDGHAVLFLGTTAAAFDSAIQGPLLEGIREAFDRLANAGDLALGQSGVNRFAVSAERSIKADIARISTLSILGLVLLFLLLFRSLRLVALASLPIGAGMLAGCAATLAVFGRVHGLTLAFGASLIGVCIDYVIHFYCHQTLEPDPDGPHRTLDHIWPGLLLGGLTTVAGFVALGFSSFPGLREVALFASVGILAALAATRWLVPGLVPRRPRPVAFQVRLANGLNDALTLLTRHRAALWLLLAAAIALAVFAIPSVRWDDGVSTMAGALDAELLAEDTAVRERVARFEQRRFVFAIGDDEDAALRANDAVKPHLEAALAAGELGGYSGLFDLLPSAHRQAEVADAIRGDRGLWERLRAVLIAEGFRAEMFEPFRDLLSSEPVPPLRYGDLAASPLAPMVRSLRISLGDRTAFVTLLNDVRKPDALAGRLAAVPGALFLDQAALMERANRAYRERTLQLLLVGLLCVLCLVAGRYRSLRMTVAAFLPAVLAAGVTVAVLALLGVAVNLLVLTALLMVLSMGVDYGVFLVEAVTRRPQGLPATLLSVLVACLSTVLGFGLLGLSDHPALVVIGSTAAVGVTASLLLAPATLVLVRKEARP